MLMTLIVELLWFLSIARRKNITCVHFEIAEVYKIWYEVFYGFIWKTVLIDYENMYS